MQLKFFILITLLFCACNIFSLVDSPSTHHQVYLDGVAKADLGDCGAARDNFLSITLTDPVAEALGWAYLCIAGANTVQITSTLYKYSQDSSDFTIIGVLARSLLPMTSTKFAEIDRAIESFNKIQNTNLKNLNLGIGRLVRAAALLADQAKNASGTATLERADIDTNCATDCSSCSSPGMNNDSVSGFALSISNAANDLSTTGAGNLQVLANSIRSGTSSAIGGSGNAARCFIFSRLIPST